MIKLYQSSKGGEIKKELQTFYSNFSYLPIEDFIKFFACFGGSERYFKTEGFLPLNSEIDLLLKDIENIKNKIEPFFIFTPPFKNFLINISKGDGRLFSLFKKSNLSNFNGGQIVDILIKENILYIENSREKPLKKDPSHTLKKELRHYRIQPKIRFNTPFLKFWFGFIEPFFKEIKEENFTNFWKNFDTNKNRLYSYIFELISLELLKEHFKNDPIVSSGTFWDRFSEYDIFCITQSQKYIVGECKFMNRAITASEVFKLKQKINQSQIDANILALFSKNGYSKELKRQENKNLLLFELNDFKLFFSKIAN